MKPIFSLLLLAGLPCWGTPIYGQPVTGELDGFRTPGSGGLTAGGSYTGTFRIAWDIDADPTGGWLYVYTLSGYHSPGVSHIILDLCGVACSGSTLISDHNPAASLEYKSFGPSPSNPGFPAGALILGVKVDDLSAEGPFTLTFHSSASPVYGHLYLKGGSGSFVYNTGLADPASANPLAFVVRPGGCDSAGTPEPATAWTLGCTLGLLGLSKALRKPSRAARRGNAANTRSSSSRRGWCCDPRVAD